MVAYPACFYKEKDGAYSVIFPDLNHLSTCGNNFDEAVRMAEDCLAGYIQTVKAEKETLPKATSISDVDIDAEYDGYESACAKIISVAD